MHQGVGTEATGVTQGLQLDCVKLFAQNSGGEGNAGGGG